MHVAISFSNQLCICCRCVGVGERERVLCLEQASENKVVNQMHMPTFVHNCGSGSRQVLTSRSLEGFDVKTVTGASL